MQKKISLLFKVKPFLCKESLLSLYYYYIYSYVNFSNAAQGNSNIANLKNINNQQRQGFWIMFNKGKFEDIRSLFR